MLERLPRPTLIAHRGASAHAPENTLAAFKLAVEKKADAIELDAKLSADGQVVVIHDLSVKRTTDGSGLVGSLPFAQLRELDAGSHFDFAFRGERIPTLSEVFEEVGKSLYIDIELTNYLTIWDRLPEKVAELVRLHGMTHRVFFSSYSSLVLLRIHRLLPACPIGLLAWPGLAGAITRSPLVRIIPHQALHPALPNSTQKLVQQVQSSGRRVYVYTVNEPQDMQRMFDIGVDGIITDDPLLARHVLSGMVG